MGGELLGTATCRRVGVTEPRAGLPPPPGRLGCWAQGGGDGFRRRPPPVRWVLSPHNVPSRPGNKPRGVLSPSLLPRLLAPLCTQDQRLSALTDPQ